MQRQLLQRPRFNPDGEPDATGDPGSNSDSKRGSNLFTDLESLVGADPYVESDAVADAKPDSVTDAKSDTVANPEFNAVADAEPDSITDAKPDSVTDAKPDSVTDAKPDTVAN